MDYENARGLPGVDDFAAALGQSWPETPMPILNDISRSVVERARAHILAGQPSEDLEAAAHQQLASIDRSRHKTVVNATGVLLHTNLGRAPLAVDGNHLGPTRYANTEIDLGDGSRSQRGSYVTRLLRALTGAEDALVVNNNAGALVLVLAALAAGSSVPISRGELIEIGGSYRLPDVIAASGAEMVEVGTTNKTRPSDYITALQIHPCGAILKVHPSNYSVEGFVEETSIADLAGVADGVPIIHDVGSGLLDAEASFLDPGWEWLKDEPGVRQSLAAGADVVLFSGDKLLGGPQAGVIVGKRELVEKIREHPLSRAFRVGTPVLAALEATLTHYINQTASKIPFWQMAGTTRDQLATRLKALTAGLNQETVAEIVEGFSLIGGGAVPGKGIVGPQLRLRVSDSAFEQLLHHDPPIVTRRDRGRLVVDLRTVDPADDPIVVEALRLCL